MVSDFHLHIDQAGKLSDEIGLVYFGINKIEGFSQRLVSNLHIDQTTANKITDEVNNKLFLPIRELLQKLPPTEKSPVNIKETTTPPTTQDPLITLGRKYNLSPEQQTNLAAVMAKVKTGEYKLGVLAATLHTTLGVDFKTAEGLTNDLTAQILAAPAAPVPATTGTNIFESKMGQMFKLPKEQVDLPEVKPWSTDPYMEKPE
jgi:hypothetical protein